IGRFDCIGSSTFDVIQMSISNSTFYYRTRLNRSLSQAIFGSIRIDACIEPLLHSGKK
ncbi:hypothetical protein RDWZM_008152, partial [Blomia tropicalis]